MLDRHSFIFKDYGWVVSVKITKNMTLTVDLHYFFPSQICL